MHGKVSNLSCLFFYFVENYLLKIYDFFLKDPLYIIYSIINISNHVHVHYRYDRTLGGLDIQLRLRDHLGKKFNEQKKTKNDVFKNPRALAKLFKEACRLKNVLSANAEHYAQVEGLLDEQDFKLLVTREDLEGLCSDIFEKVNQPIEKALKAAGLSMDLVSQVSEFLMSFVINALKIFYLKYIYIFN